MSEIKMGMELNDKELSGVAGGVNVRELPEFEKIRNVYKEKGIRTASALSSHYYGDDIAIEIMKELSKE